MRFRLTLTPPYFFFSSLQYQWPSIDLISLKSVCCCVKHWYFAQQRHIVSGRKINESIFYHAYIRSLLYSDNMKIYLFQPSYVRVQCTIIHPYSLSNRWLSIFCSFFHRLCYVETFIHNSHYRDTILVILLSYQISAWINYWLLLIFIDPTWS